jgi:hypothetical protein
MTSENENDEKKIEMIRRVSHDGNACPDGVDCPAQWRTNWGQHITVGLPVTDPEVLAMLKLGPGEIAVVTPDALWAEP